MGNNLTPELRAEIVRSKTPIVLAGTIDSDHVVASVNIDYKVATQEAVQTLIENGHKKIAFVTASLKNTFASDLRLDGYKEALSVAKIDYNEKFIFEIPLTYQSGEALSEKLLNAGITAAIVTDDEAAVGLLNGLYDHGVNVPKDFEVISSNNSKLTKMTRPTLTTIAPPLYDIGAVAMRLLTKIMNKEEVVDTEITLPYKIEYRQTTK